MKQYIEIPTRITDTRTIIDLIFANEDIDTEVLLAFPFEDHAVLQIMLRKEIKKTK